PLAVGVRVPAAQGLRGARRAHRAAAAGGLRTVRRAGRAAAGADAVRPRVPDARAVRTAVRPGTVAPRPERSGRLPGLRRTRSACQPDRPPAARARRAEGRPGRSGHGPRHRHGCRTAGHPEVRRRLRAARPRLPRGPPGLHGRRCRPGRAGHPAGPCRALRPARAAGAGARCPGRRARGAAGHAAGPRRRRGRSRVPGLRHLHLRLHRPPEARGGAAPASPASVIYTSGSTGRPKGVVVPHRAVSNFIASMQSEPGLDAQDRLLAVTTLSFDIAVLELMLPLSVGGEIVLAGRESAIDGLALVDLLREAGITAMQATPATWRLLLEAGWQGSAGFKAMCGGEPLPPDLAQALLARCGELWNLYGPTETTVWSTATCVQPAAAGALPDIHIGRPIANTQVWILDEHGQPCPLGVPGEICI